MIASLACASRLCLYYGLLFRLFLVSISNDLFIDVLNEKYTNILKDDIVEDF
jgi:hypothetical protein